MPHTVLFFHAHPDDEALLTSGTMAKLAAEGHRVVLVVATAGEAGLSAAELRADGTLGDRRLAELRSSAGVLGVARTEFLGYADSGLAAQPSPPSPPGTPPRLADADVDEVAGRLAEILVQEQAMVLTSYDAAGGYGHPDHLAVHAIAARAAEMAGTPTVLEATVPRDRLLAVARAVNRLLPTSRRIDLGPWAVAYSRSADITHRIDVRAQAPQRRASMMAHASQATGGPRTLGVFTRVPMPFFRIAFGREWYRQARPVPSREVPSRAVPSRAAGDHRLTDIFQTL
ncbi:PIG-L deacetylase family protein [Nakamurella sp. GG22]